ncbi:uncharacterized protein LOC126882902 [Diabrotica virgifera virgifera]|uniref:Uncharacterized protein LOC114342182 n=1 Tax=Diabrotica virgifera virgifera TaxID=50390 RepID=A0A6P7GGB6_DIAVI|nr:uncharacterized protein LOC126882902 [Diabrotica virgifera virgifera]
MAPRKPPVGRPSRGASGVNKIKNDRPFSPGQIAKNRFYNFLKDMKKTVPGVNLNKLETESVRLRNKLGAKSKTPYSTIARRSRRKKIRIGRRRRSRNRSRSRKRSKSHRRSTIKK